MFTEIIKDKWENKNKNDKAAIELWNSKADYFGSYELENVQNERFIQIIKKNNLINNYKCSINNSDNTILPQRRK